MNTMKAKYLLPLLALSVAAAQAGERESFDFGWSSVKFVFLNLSIISFSWF